MTVPAGPTDLRMGTPAARWVLLTTVLGSGLVMLDGTVVNVALERIGAELGASFGGLQWTVNAYTLTLASLILLGGSLGDRFGRRRVFVIGVVWFAVASLLCGLAPNLELLVAGRALQGVGGALLTPGSLALISASFRGPDRAAAIGAWSGLGGIAGAVGPFVGGWLVEWTWRAVFLINLPLAVLVVVVALRHVPETRDPDAAPGLDVPGTVLAAAVARGPDLVADRARRGRRRGRCRWPCWRWGWSRSPRSSPSSTGRGTRWCRPQLFADREFTAANVATLLVYGALGVVFLLLVMQLQVVAGFSPTAAGAALLPVTAIMLVFSARAGCARAADRAAAADDGRAAGQRGRVAAAAGCGAGRELGR